MNKTVKGFFAGVIFTGFALVAGDHIIDRMNQKLEFEEQQIKKHVEMIYSDIDEGDIYVVDEEQ